jgi:guanylate kinase
MTRKYKLSAALDVDDLLMECTSYAIRLANEKYKFDPPMTIYEKDRWGKIGTRVDSIYPYFQDPEFYRTQPVYEGAKEFVRKLSRMTEVFICTAVPPQFMGIRAQRIMEEFPEIPEDHIYMGARKDNIHTDILFDDAMHNILNSSAKYPVLMRRPWNQEATGMLAVNYYDEFLKIVEVIGESYSAKSSAPSAKNADIVVLVGPSSSGKSKIAARLLTENQSFEKLTSYTTKDPTALVDNNWYSYVSIDDFRQMCDSGEMFQSTMYAGHGYGSKKEDIENILASGKRVLTTMDICGAMSLKTQFKNVTAIYVKREKRAVMANIIQKNSSVQDKVNRLVALEYEDKNAGLCDYVIDFEDYDEALDQLRAILK